MGWWIGGNGEEIWICILSAIEEFISEKHLRHIVIFYFAMNHDVLGGEQWPEKILKRGVGRHERRYRCLAK